MLAAAITPAAALTILGAYLLGSIPTAYLVARFSAGIDIREYGSGNIGASNVVAHVGLWTGLSQGAFDCLAKGVLPVVAGGLLGVELWALCAAGLAAVAGHNWSPFLRFTGGRGVAPALGAALALGMWQEILILGVATLVVGRIITRDTGFWTFAALLALPFVSLAFRRPAEIVACAAGICAIMLLKRLTANWETPPPQYPFRRVLLYRLIWDRDVPKRMEWTERRPS